MSGRKICSDCHQRYGYVLTLLEDRNSPCEECAQRRRSNLEQIDMNKREKEETTMKLEIELENHKVETAKQAALDQAEFNKMKARKDAQHARQIEIKQEERKLTEINIKAKIEKEKTAQAEEKRKEIEAIERTKQEAEHTKQMETKKETLSHCSNIIKYLSEANMLNKEDVAKLINQALSNNYAPAARTEASPTTTPKATLPPPMTTTPKATLPPPMTTTPKATLPPPTVTKFKHKRVEKSMKKAQPNNWSEISNTPNCTCTNN